MLVLPWVSLIYMLTHSLKLFLWTHSSGSLTLNPFCNYIPQSELNLSSVTTCLSLGMNPPEIPENSILCVTPKINIELSQLYL